MLETPHQIAQRPRRGLVPLAVSALLAFALVPGLAVAEDSSGIQYSDAPPTVTGKTSDKDSKSRANSGGGSDQSSTRPGSNADGTADDGAGGDKGGAGGGSGDGGKGGAAGQGANGEGADGVSAGKPLDVATASSDDGGSSPLVPILIALAVLAAISVGVVAMRKKREDADPGAPASPEAG